jgi:hypothetical protein
VQPVPWRPNAHRVSDPVTSVSDPVTSVSDPVTSVSDPVTSVSDPVTSVSGPRMSGHSANDQSPAAALIRSGSGRRPRSTPS